LTVEGFTRSEILAALPEMPDGSFDRNCLKAGIKMIHKRPQKERPHLTEYVYPLDSIERLKAVMRKGGN
jgi:hypothetical protein